MTPEQMSKMTPFELMSKGEMSEKDYKEIVDVNEEHKHISDEKVEIPDFWDDNLIIKKKKIFQ